MIKLDSFCSLLVESSVTNGWKRVRFPSGARVVSIQVNMFDFQLNETGAVPVQLTFLSHFMIRIT